MNQQSPTMQGFDVNMLQSMLVANGQPATTMAQGVNAASNTSPQALMNALNLLQQNIGALQALIPLIAQQQTQPDASRQSELLQQQQSVASAGIASVISQLAVAASNILPQAGLSLLQPQQRQQPAQQQPAAVEQRMFSGLFPASSPAQIVHVQQQQQQQQQQLSQQQAASTPPVSQQLMLGSFQHQHQQQFEQRQQPQHISAGNASSAVVNATSNAGTSSPFYAKQPETAVREKNVTAVREKKEAIEAAGAKDSADDDNEEDSLPDGSFDIVEMDPVELLAEHTHFCEICGKGFKRDANLRMHMRGHGDEYKTAAALARPDKHLHDAQARPKRFSCPYAGCKRNCLHRRFAPLKSMLCVKNHYRRSHCPKMLACSKCGSKRFSVVADLKTHEKHCGKDRWVCSCGTTFSRKDKLTGHLALFIGHAPAAPPAGATSASAAPMLSVSIGSQQGDQQALPAVAVAPLVAGQQGAERGMGEGQVMPPPAAPGRKGEGEVRDVSSCSSGGEVGENDMRVHHNHAPLSLPLRDCISSNLNLNHSSANPHDSEEREVVVYHERPMQLYLTPSAGALRADAVGHCSAPAAERSAGALITADLLGSAVKNAH